MKTEPTKVRKNGIIPIEEGELSIRSCGLAVWRSCGLPAGRQVWKKGI